MMEDVAMEKSPRDDNDGGTNIHGAALDDATPAVNNAGDDWQSTSSSSNANNTFVQGQDGNRNNDDDDSSRLVGNETKQVVWSRLLFVAVLVAAAAGCAVGVYHISRNDERNSFEVRFKDFANQIVEVSQMNANDIFGIFERMSLFMTVYTQAHNYEWPNVFIPRIESLGQQAIQATGARTVAVTIIVTDDTKDGFEDFVANNLGWVGDELEYAGSNQTSEIQPKIWSPGPDRTTIYPENQGTYIPSIYMSPITTLHPFINYDAYNLKYFNSVFHEMNRTRRAVLSEIRNLGVNVTSSADWPRSFMAVPIFDTLGSDQKVVGQLTAQMPWHAYFLNLVPDDVDGIYMVVRNTCNQSFTYRIDGPRVDYKGPGDLHDTSFDELEVSATFTAFRSLEECVFSFHLYPSDEFQKTYTTLQPIVNTVVVVAVFILTAIFFIFYDQLVEKRQHKVLTTATKSKAIVNSLFPENVRERLMMEQEEASPHNATTPHGRRLDAFRIGHRHSVNNNNDLNFMKGPVKITAPPIADYFESVTVVFADIVNFTQWSSARQPVDVFELLETIYNSFDAIAMRMQVFKVETIGDCYVAVCGLPTIRDDHAMVMFQFCKKCLQKMQSLVATTLMEDLGPDTADLKMRFGLHSGPVTAGVLRGQKSRFQLFGDTVNTAARVETSGAPNRIHISQATADELLRFGKSRWIRHRDDRVTAKGKGVITTYWGVWKESDDSCDDGRKSFERANQE